MCIGALRQQVNAVRLLCGSAGALNSCPTKGLLLLLLQLVDNLKKYFAKFKGIKTLFNVCPHGILKKKCWSRW